MNSEQSRRQTILVVEDDVMLRGILAQALADEGHSVLTAADGEEALAITSTLDGQLGLVVIDLMLPLMDGLELADQLTQLNRPPPMLFISGIRTNRQLPGPILVKPFGPGTFLDHVGRMLRTVQPH
jgi:DNA-binding response OmpR family regulator